jgi:hypothetical protein
MAYEVRDLMIDVMPHDFHALWADAPPCPAFSDIPPPCPAFSDIPPQSNDCCPHLSNDPPPPPDPGPKAPDDPVLTVDSALEALRVQLHAALRQTA